MPREGYWSLFWQTGLPQAYLAAREGGPEARAPAAPAEGPGPGDPPARTEGTGDTTETG